MQLPSRYQPLTQYMYMMQQWTIHYHPKMQCCSTTCSSLYAQAAPGVGSLHLEPCPFVMPFASHVFCRVPRPPSIVHCFGQVPTQSAGLEGTSPCQDGICSVFCRWSRAMHQLPSPLPCQWPSLVSCVGFFNIGFHFSMFPYGAARLVLPALQLSHVGKSLCGTQIAIICPVS